MSPGFSWCALLLVAGAASGAAGGAPAGEPVAGAVPEIVMATDVEPAFGAIEGNCPFSPEAARERVERLQAASRPVTVRELLGGEIDLVLIDYVAPDLDPDAAIAEVRSWLDAVVFDPAVPGAGDLALHLPWSEGVPLSVRGRLRYAPRYEAAPGVKVHAGSAECSAHFDLGGPSHFVARDVDGVYWWYRWSRALPRRQLGEPSPSPPAPDPRPAADSH